MRTIVLTEIVLGFLMAVACTKGPAPEGSRAAISFSVETGDMAGTRAPGETVDLPQDGYTFGVLAYDTGRYVYGDSNVNPNFMYNEDVTYSFTTGQWSYSPEKYWPNGEDEVSGNTGGQPEYLTFFAYAPYSDMNAGNPAGYCIPTLSEQSEAGNPWLIYRIHEDVSHQVDLLYAAPVVDQLKPDVDDKVQFRFKHALACVGEQVSVSLSSSMTVPLEEESASTGDKIQVILNTVRVRYHLTARAKLQLWNTGSTALWQPLLNGEQTTDRIVTYGNNLGHCLYSTLPIETEGAWASAEGMGVFYIPLDVEGSPQTVTLIVDYTVRRTMGGDMVDTPGHRESSFTLNSYPESFVSGKKLSSIGIVLL